MTWVSNTAIQLWESWKVPSSSNFRYSQLAQMIKIFWDLALGVVEKLWKEHIQRTHFSNAHLNSLDGGWVLLTEWVELFFQKLESIPEEDKIWKIPVTDKFSSEEYSSILESLNMDVISDKDIELIFFRLFIMFSNEKYNEIYPTIEDKKRKLYHFLNEQIKWGKNS
jgi:hypothetical protein